MSRYYLASHLSLSSSRVCSKNLFREKQCLGEMATKEKTTKQRKTQQTHDLSNAHNTFEYSTNTTAVEEKLFGGNQEDEEPDDGPLVFICAKCKIPVGDSLSWDGSEDGQSQIRLKRESHLDIDLSFEMLSLLLLL